MNNFNYDITIIVKKILGVLLIILGIIGLFLPFFQGLLLIGFGLTLIYPKFSNHVKNFTDRFRK